MAKASPLPQDMDRDLAALAAAVYDVNAQQVGKWTRVLDPNIRAIPAGQGPTSKPDKNSGFKAAVFSDGKTNVLAFAGSERETRDWLTNFAQGLGLDTAQYRQAAAFAQECKQVYGKSLVLTGHSLGGGLAAVASAVTNTQCVTFNPAGLHSNTLKRAGIDPQSFREAAENGLIRKYVVQGEILSRVNGIPVLAPKAPGALIELQDAKGSGMFGKHSMVNVQASLDAKSTKSVTASEAALAKPDPQREAMALAFRKQKPDEAIKSFPGLATAYKVLETAEARWAGMKHQQKDNLVAQMREHLAGRIEKGEQIKPPRKPTPHVQQVLAARTAGGPER